MLACTLVILLALIESSRESGSAPASTDYVWKSKDKYYYNNLEEKMNEILIGNCLKEYKKIKDGVLEVPVTSKDIYVSSFPVSPEISEWWRAIPKPAQMRVEPYLCANVYTKKIPIFNNTGCQLASYMSPSAPRCQTKYLRWICEKSQIDVTDSTPNHFVIPEADHATTQFPPQPYMIMARDSFVSMCGQISTQCGKFETDVCLVHHCTTTLLTSLLSCRCGAHKCELYGHWIQVAGHAIPQRLSTVPAARKQHGEWCRRCCMCCRTLNLTHLFA